MDGGFSYILIIIAIIIVFFIFLYFVPLNLWITAIFSGVRVGLLELVAMRIRKVPPSVIVNSLITARKAGLEESWRLIIWQGAMYHQLSRH